MEKELPILYKIKTGSVEDINLHLNSCNDSFIPPLTDRISIKEYAQKIYDQAITFEAWHNNDLIGLIAAYFSDFETGTAFITNVSVYAPYKGNLIASKLLAICVKYALQNKFKLIKLEVNRNNTPAINFYKKHHFTYTETKEESIFLTRQINTLIIPQ